MHSDKDNPATAQDTLEGSKESTLEWLMELDRDEPEENLFKVDGKVTELSLSAFETEFAARPMTRGRTGADDLDTYISEEIVLSEDGNTNANGSAGDEDGEDAALDGLMAIDFSRQDEIDNESQSAAVDDGSDILGLADEDDMGESFLVVKRVPKAAQEKPAVITPIANGAEAEILAAETNAAPEVTANEAQPEPGEAVEDLVAMAETIEEIVVEDVSGDGFELPDEEPVDAVGMSADNVEAIVAAGVIEENEPALVDMPVTDVTAYVASVDAPENDEAFDAFLLAGSDLDEGEEDFDALVLSEEELAFSVDTDLDDDLELHDDFVAMDGFENDLMAVITPRVASFMEEVNAAVGARLVALGKPGDAVVADVSIATDAETRATALEQGYEPVMAICGAVPEALAGLQQTELDAVMLRLGEVETGETCNSLFQEDPAAPDAPASLAPLLTVVENNVFDDDIFGEDIEGAIPAAEWAPESEEIDAIFDDFGGDDFSLEFDTPLPDVEEMAAASALYLQEEQTEADVGGEQQEVLPEVGELPGIEHGARTVAETVDAPVVEVTPAEPDVLGDSNWEDEVLQVFEEDIFDTDLTEEEALEAASAEHIDRLLEDLGADTELPGEICGVEVEAFAGSSANEELSIDDAPEEAPVEVAIPAVAQTTEDMSWCIPQGIDFHHSSPGSGEIFAEFLEAFIEEGSSELEKLEDAVSAWEADIADEQSFTQVARILHTIKGIAKGVGLHFYGTLIHNFETLLERMPRPATGEEHDYFRIVNAWLDAAVRGLDFVQDQRRDIVTEFPSRGDITEPTGAAGEIETTVVSEDAAVEEQLQPGLAVAEPMVARQPEKDARRKQEDKRLADEGARALAAQQSVRITSEKLDLLLNLSNQAQQLGVRTAQSTTRNKRASAELMGRLSSVRAHIADIADRTLFNVSARSATRASDLDALEMDQYSDLQEAANILREGVEDLADLIEVASRHNAQAEALLKQQASVIGSIGSTIRAARVVPVSRLMPGLRRLVRTVSNDLGKDVAFRVANELGTLDRDDYTRCQTILEHMVRNALDHGIETTEERKATGKPSVGQITVDVRMSGADSVIVLSDDGRGIDPDAMRESAIRKGLDVDADALSDDEARNLIFHKGFSTAQTLSQISGRGVGMDIVLSELQQMGGDIRIESAVGKGTSFHIRVPTNVTVNGALLVSAGENSYAIPLGGLISVDEVPVEQFFNAVETGETLQLSGLECEPAYLGTLCQSCNLPDHSAWRHTVPVIVAGSEARYMAIAIDDVEEALELVIRSLGAQFASVPGVAGAATTADGEAVVALDLNVLVSCFAEGQGTAVADEQPEEEKFLALVVDDSRTQRMVATSQLETVGIETATAENGAVAIDWLNTTEHLPDVILLDVEMPVKDGIQTLREIRKSARYSHIPVIMVTSRTGIKHRTMAEEAGCNGYMGKPFNFRMLIGQINELTGQRLELG
ncbi:hybrid sensor histidine kinase/response regulator [Pseudohalioglobus lutimaris]|uniref:Chemotaxis protein CheA n=1 Tax=Pseudohalioglobus lutimaris TaxID=1737061 RepID=A0A2N5X768_9GAMM|nr:response regulator [Pseudohalioglobus lutimaris]PLW70320.1 hypothetical protein C0039_03690 [Pseudohalioglobus lutimaris]